MTRHGAQSPAIRARSASGRGPDDRRQLVGQVPGMVEALDADHARLLADQLASVIRATS